LALFFSTVSNACAPRNRAREILVRVAKGADTRLRQSYARVGKLPIKRYACSVSVFKCLGTIWRLERRLWLVGSEFRRLSSGVAIVAV
jgi:hypothetical protein